MQNNHWQHQLKQLGESEKERIRQERIAQEQVKKEETIHFADAMTGVIPLKNSGRRERDVDLTPIQVRPKNHEENSENHVFVGDGEYSSEEPPKQYAHGGGGKNDIRKLLQHQEHEMVATLDLHGYRQEEAQNVLNEFIDYVQKRGVMGEIIHGSGLGSKGFVSSIKRLTRRWLMQHSQVLAYVEPPHNDGAVWILLKRKNRRNDDFA